MGAKATDLAFFVGDNKVGLAEVKLRRAIKDALSGRYARITYIPFVNDESAPSYAQLFSNVFGDKPSLSLLFPGDAEFQKNLPNINKKTGKLTLLRTAPGNHGQWGVMMLMKALHHKQ